MNISTMVFKTLIFWFLMTPYSAATFEFKCPHLSQRRFRAIGVCQDESKYSCLLDIIEEAYIEMCNQTADYVVRGQKYVISGGRRSYPCSLDRYQPFKFWLHVQSQCYYKKTLCNEDGQIIYSHTSAKDDNMCRCNFTNGYGLITKPRSECYCIPSQEDCSCYKVQCPANTTLSSDETCSFNGSYGGSCNTAGTTRFGKTLLNITPIAVEDLFTVSMHKAVMVPLIATTLVLGLSVIAVILLLKCEVTEDNNSQARFLQLKTSSITRNRDIKDFKDKKIKLTVLKPEDKQNFPPLFIQRVNRCSGTFVKELSMYPQIPERAVEPSVELAPLVDDVQIAVEESVRTGGLNHLFENCFHDRQIMRYIMPPNNRVEISLRVENHIKNDTPGIPTDKYCEMSENSYILSVANKKFLHEELQPALIANIILKTDELEEYSREEKRISQIDFLISKINGNKKLFDDFLETTKKQFAYIHKRLEYSTTAYYKRHLISRNIIKNIYDLSAHNDFVLNDFQQIFVEREVFTDETFIEIERITDNEEKQMLEFLVKIIQTGTQAMFTFVDALYLNGENRLAEILISNESQPECNQESAGNNNTELIVDTNQEDMLLLARFEAYFI